MNESEKWNNSNILFIETSPETDRLRYVIDKYVQLKFPDIETDKLFAEANKLRGHVMELTGEVDNKTPKNMKAIVYAKFGKDGEATDMPRTEWAWVQVDMLKDRYKIRSRYFMFEGEKVPVADITKCPFRSNITGGVACNAPTRKNHACRDEHCPLWKEE